MSNDSLKRHISYLVHDIAPAIAAFDSVTQLVDTGALDLGKISHRQLIEDTKSAIAYSKLLIENLLEFNYLSEEKVRGSFKEIDWDVFLKESLALPSILAREKKIEISGENLNPGSIGFSNSMTLRRIIQNILVNSIKYCPPGSKVRIEMRSDSGRTDFVISDDGPGLSFENIESIFDESVQLDLRASGDFKGVGIGLAFCKEATFLLNGSLTVKNRTPHGLQFTLSVPKR
jgi:K+-sensing histidine kinase KdpD